MDCQGLVARLVLDFVLLTTAVEVASRWRELAEKLARVSRQQMEAYEAPHRDKNGLLDNEVTTRTILKFLNLWPIIGLIFVWENLEYPQFISIIHIYFKITILGWIHFGALTFDWPKCNIFLFLLKYSLQLFLSSHTNTLVHVETSLWLPTDLGRPRWWQLPWHNPRAPHGPGQDEEPHHQEVEALDWHTHPGQLPGHPPRCCLLSHRLRWFCSMNTMALLREVQALVEQLLLLFFSFAFGSSGWTLPTLVLTRFLSFLGKWTWTWRICLLCFLFGLRFTWFLSPPKLFSTSFCLHHLSLNFTFFFCVLFSNTVLSFNQAVCDGHRNTSNTAVYFHIYCDLWPSQHLLRLIWLQFSGLLHVSWGQKLIYCLLVAGYSMGWKYNISKFFRPHFCPLQGWQHVLVAC